MTYQRDYERQVKKLQMHIIHRIAFYGFCPVPMTKAMEALNGVNLLIPTMSNGKRGRRQLNAVLKESQRIIYRF